VTDLIYDDRPLGPPPPPTSENTTKTMKANKAKDTKPELILRKRLRASGFPGYRLHWKCVPGRPDISYIGRKVAIFVNGCFWHRCPHCNLPLPKSNTEFWRRKFGKNVERDKRKKKVLEDLGWRVFVFWECEIKSDPQKYVDEIIKFLNENPSEKTPKL